MLRRAAEFLGDSMLVTVVVPVYNSPVLDELATGIAAVFTAGADDYEIVFVDDGSTAPGVWPTLERLAAADPRVRAVQLTRNFGQHAATLCGLRESRGDVVITMDDDLQHDPEDIPRLLASRDHDIAIGQLTHRQHGVTRRLVSRAKGFCDRVILDKPPAIQLTSFRMLNRSVVDGMIAVRTAHPFIPALLLHVTRDVVGVPVTHRARSAGRSGYTIAKLLRVFGNLVFSNSTLVLRLVGSLGLVSIAAGVVYALLTLGGDPTGGRPGFAPTVIVAIDLVTGGVVLLGLSLVGEHVRRIMAVAEARPPYVVRRRCG